ncbi:MAG TPA: hypothetical protein VJZ71_20495 [Phycisphaerae bacterium]|nr:hypothetical protein [Phycisphaerae bacterium]
MLLINNKRRWAVVSKLPEHVVEKRNEVTTTVPSEWPAPPAAWPELLTDVELAQYLRMDMAGHDPASAKRALRFIRRTQNLPDVGRIAGRVLFRRAAVDEWLAGRERRQVAPAAAVKDEHAKALQDDDRNVRP